MTNTLESHSATTISRLHVPELHELPDNLRQQLESLERQLGYIPNWASALSLGGAHAARFNDYILGLLDPNTGRLPYVDREVRELSPRHRTLARFAGKLSLHPGEIEDADIDELRDLGLNDEEIFEAVHVISAFAAANRFTIFLQVTPDDQFFN